MPTAPRTELLLRSYARAKARYMSELGERRLVFPDSKDFPDTFASDEPSARHLLERMQAHAGMADIPISLRVADLNSAEEGEGSSCSSGACAPTKAPAPTNLARVVDEGDSWRFVIPSAELRHPVLLTTGLARSLALVFIVETEEPGDPAPNPGQVELVAVLLGFGGLLLQGAHVYQKSCAGPRVDQFTALDVNEAALLSAVMALDSGSGLGRLPRLVEATQKAALDEAMEVLRPFAPFLQRLKSDPLGAAESQFVTEKPAGLWGKLKARLLPGDSLPGDDLAAWQKALASAPRAKALPPPPSQELIDLVKSEL